MSKQSSVVQSLLEDLKARPELSTVSQIAHLSEEIMRTSRDMVGLSEQMYFRPNVLDISNRVMSLSLQIADLNTQLIRVLHTHTRTQLSHNQLTSNAGLPHHTFSPNVATNVALVSEFAKSPPTSLFGLQQPVPLPSFITPNPAPLLNYHEYGDCGETLPLVVMTNVLEFVTREEVRSVAVFTNKLESIMSISDNEPIKQPVRLKDACLNCLDLMLRIPDRITMFAAAGSYPNITWIEGNSPPSAIEMEQGTVNWNPLINIPGLSLSAAFDATTDEIYAILREYTISNSNPFLSAGRKQTLAILWAEFIVPFRDQLSVFRLNTAGNVDPIMVKLNNLQIPICTIFCALAYILSMVLSPQQREAQQRFCYMQLLAVLAKWCRILCPWAFPNLVSVVYCKGNAPDKCFLLGTSKPVARLGVTIQSMHMSQMRGFRKIVLQTHFGTLRSPCPVRAAAESVV